MIRNLLRAVLYSLIASLGAAWFLGLLTPPVRVAPQKKGGPDEIDAEGLDAKEKAAMLAELEAQL